MPMIGISSHYTKPSEPHFSDRGQKVTVTSSYYTKPSKPTICQCHYYLHVIKLLKNTELKCTNNASHEVKEFRLLKLPVGAHNARGRWALRVGPVHGRCRSINKTNIKAKLGKKSP